MNIMQEVDNINNNVFEEASHLLDVNNSTSSAEHVMPVPPADLRNGGPQPGAHWLLNSDSHVQRSSAAVVNTMRSASQRAVDPSMQAAANAMDPRVIHDLNSSILQAAEIQNRIKKVHQLEVSPLIDTYGSLNEPHAHPLGLLSGLNQ